MTSTDVAAERQAVRSIIDTAGTLDPAVLVERLVDPVDRLIDTDPDASLAVHASLTAWKVAIRAPGRDLEVITARMAHRASRAAGDRPAAARALERLREAAEAAGSVEGLYDATWFELVESATRGDRFGIRRSVGALRSFATARQSHRAVALHRAARCLTDAFSNPSNHGGWPDGTPFAEDRALGPALAAWIALDEGRPEDARFALDRVLETEGLDRIAASVRSAALVVVARACARLDATEHAPDILDALGTVSDAFVITGTQPVRWLGSVDLVSAEVALVAGDRTQATARLDAARDACDALGAPSMQGRIDVLARRLARRPGRTREGGGTTCVTPMLDRSVRLERTGTMWHYRRADIDVVLPHRKGLGQLCRLLAQPGREHHCVDLLDPGAPRQGGIEMLDEQARDSYRARYDDLLATIREAEAWNDDEREFRAREELSALADELARGVGLGGRARHTGSTVERARVNVTRTIRAATALIAEHDALFGAHLERCVGTGTYCVYVTDGAFDVAC